METAEELHDLHRRVVDCRLGLGHEVLEERDVAGGIAFDEGRARWFLLGK